MKIKKIIYCLSTLIILSLYSCKNKEYQITESGIKYKFFVKNEKGLKVKGGYFIDYHLVQKNHKDSVLGDVNDVQMFPDDTVKGNPLIEVFRLMAEGDSAVFLFSTDTLLAQNKKAMQARIDGMKQQMAMMIAQAPSDSAKQSIQQQWQAQIEMGEKQMNTPDPQLPPGEYFSILIKINGVKTEEEMRKAQEEKLEKQKKTDDKAIVEYLKKNKLEAKATASGLYYLIEKEGSGPQPKRGDQVSVNYVGRFMDGKIFDTSSEEVAKKNNVYNPQRQYVPLQFPLGVQPMIKGWEEAMYLIKEGSTAKIFLPSHLAYGPAGSPPNIAPNTIIMFELELVKVQAGPQIPDAPSPR